MKKVAVLGTGQVGDALANGFLKHGYAVMRGSRDPSKLAAWQQGAGPHAKTGTFGEAAEWGEIVVLAVKGAAAEPALELAGGKNLAGKVVIDTTNPIAEAPPTNGVLHFFTTLEDSLMERLQRRFPEARFVKAFSCVGNAYMVDPDLPGGPPTMFVCGNDAGAKREVNAILARFGWDVEDLGAVEAARAIEPLCILWCLPGFTQNRWTHAYKVLRAEVPSGTRA
jgi:8-hydroxy-5-deazaflavin:NADPH oxidoreductase